MVRSIGRRILTPGRVARGPAPVVTVQPPRDPPFSTPPTGPLRRLLLILLAAASLTASTEDPRAIVRAATLAVQADSAGALVSRWRAAASRAEGARDAILGLATIERLTYDYDAAERRYRSLFVADGASPDRHDVHARLGLGMGMDAQGLGGEPVIGLFRSALRHARALGDSTDTGEALFRLGSLLMPMGNTGPGLAYVDSALRILPASARGLRATARCRRAQFFVATMRPGSADSVETALVEARASGDAEALGFCLRAGTVLYRLRDRPEARDSAEMQLIELRRRTRDRSGLSMALLLRGDNARTQGRFGESSAILREALTEARASRNRFIEATVALGIGATSLLMNDHAVAGEYIERAIASFEASNDSASLMFGLSYRPFVSMAAGDLDRARSQTLPLIDYWRRHGDFDHLTQLYRQLASIELRAGNLDAAGRALELAHASANRIETASERGGVEYDRGRLALRRGDFAAAERGFRRFLADLAPGEQLPRYEGRLRIAEVYARRGDIAQAERELAAAGAELDAWRASLPDPELRTMAFQASAFEAGDRNASVAVVLSALASGGRATSAFELAERRRARELAERMARAHALRDTPRDAPPDTRRDTARRAADSTPGNGALVTTTPAWTAAAIARAIPDDATALLEFVTAPGGAPTTLFVLTRASAERGDVRAFRLPPADSLVGEIGRLVALIEGGEDPKTLARALGATLLDQPLRALPAAVTRLVMVPDGPLHRMPWDVLRLSDGRYVAEQYAVGVVPSAAIAATLWSGTRSRGADAAARVLVFGDPVFPATSSATTGGDIYRSGLDASGGLPRLPHSAREARLVATYGAASDIRLRERATAASLKRGSLAGYDVVHLATHALIDERFASRSVLALGAGEGETGFVGASDLATLDLDASLVVLSACRSAGGVVVDGEGIQGLTAPLLEAGARSVVATSWRIGDRATVPFIEAFYGAMADSAPVVDALRAAKVDAIRRGAPPSEWAAFTVVGDPLVRVPLVKPTTPFPWMQVAALVLGLVVIVGLTVAVLGHRRARRLRPDAA